MKPSDPSHNSIRKMLSKYILRPHSSLIHCFDHRTHRPFRAKKFVSERNPDQTQGGEEAKFGEGDASFRAAGEIAGIERLVDDFYDIMDGAEFSATIRGMHPVDLEESRDKLARFLSGWLGGPKRYQEKYQTLLG